MLFDSEYEVLHWYYASSVLRKFEAKIETELSEASFLSFTSDIWTNSKRKTSFLSLTAHWLNKRFEYKHRALHCKKVEGSHTDFNISEKI